MRVNIHFTKKGVLLDGHVPHAERSAGCKTHVNSCAYCCAVMGAVNIKERRPGPRRPNICTQLIAEFGRPCCAGMGIKLGTRSTRLYGLNLSRCLGDKFLKDGDLGLSAAPHVSPVVRLPPRASGLVVLASDGLWDVASAARAVAVRPRSGQCILSGICRFRAARLPVMAWVSWLTRSVRTGMLRSQKLPYLLST